MLKKQSKPKSNKKNLIILAVVLSNMLGSSYCSAANVSTLGELQTVTTDTSTKTRDASLITDITVPNSSSIGTAGTAGAGTVLTINGNPSGTAYSITGAGAGNNSSGWTVNSSDITFNLKNVGATSGSTITKAVQNFVSTGNGSVLNITAGTGNITNSIIYNNSSTGGAIYNGGIFNSYAGVTFAGNYASSFGSAIYNNGASAVANIDGNTFKWNGYSDYNSGTDTATTVATQNGGAIYNATSAQTNITNSTFSNNAAINDGGAIWNSSSIAGGGINIGTSGSTDTTKFINNQSTTHHGGAIYNSGTLNSYSGVTFAGNYTSTSGFGGTIYQTSSSAVANIIGNTFKWNGYSDYNSTTDTATTLAPGYGGVIFNEFSSRANITNSIFRDNAAISGGVFYNTSAGIINIGTSGSTDTTTFTSNKTTTNNGGVIFNAGAYNSYSGVTYTGNYTGATGNGGAIYNTGASAVTTIDGNTFKWNGYSNYNSGTGTATTISTTRGGAIYNDSSATANITNSTFSNNASANNGGAIFNVGTLNIGASNSIDSTSFINNKSTIAAGGAIYNNKTLNSYNGVLFAGNYTASGIGGGAIYNTGASSVATIIGNTFKWNGYSDYNPETDTASTSSTKFGGAIYNDTSGIFGITRSIFKNNVAKNSGGAIYNTGAGTITNSLFTNNTATTNGGAIYSTGFLNIIANKGITSFAGNKVGGISNAIYTTGGMVNLNSGNGGCLLFNDKITGTAGSNVYINQTGTNALATGYLATTAPTDGNVIFNDTISNVNLDLKNGQLILGQAGNTYLTDAAGTAVDNSSPHTYLNNVALTLSGGTLNTANNYLDTNYVSSLSVSDGAKIIFDTDLSLSSNNSDKLVVTGATSGPLTLQGMNIMKDSAGTSGTIDFLSSGSLNTFSTTALNTYTNHYLYTVAAGTDSGTLNYTRTGDGVTYDGLNSAVAIDTLASRTFSATSDTTVTENLGEMGLADSTLNIFGNGYSISGVNNTGIISGVYQTLNISDVGSKTNGKSWNGFWSDNGGVLNNSGILNIKNSVFSFNLGSGSGGGVLLNNGLTTTTNSIFQSNSSTYRGGAICNSYITMLGMSGLTDTTSLTKNFASSLGGAIYNEVELYSYDGVTYAGNFTGASGHGGAIYNTSEWGLATIDGNTFKWNGYSDYDTETDIATNISTQYGGAIFNVDNAIVNIKNSTFNNNASVFGGGSIYNNSFNGISIGTSNSTDTTSFINNSSSAGGAIYNSGGYIESYDGVKFAGNYSTSGHGGAIFNSEAYAFVNGNTFKHNGYSDYNPTTDTASVVSTNQGGAIYNTLSGVLYITNSTFTDNVSTSNGGAIYNGAGTTTYIQADGIGKQTLFQDNKANGISNAIHMEGTDSTTNASNLYLNAGNSGTITSFDSISGSNTGYNNIYINSSDTDASTSFIDSSTILTNGVVNLYDNITGATIYDYAGTTNFGNSSTPKAGCYNGTIFNLLGGTQNLNNGATGSTFNLTDATLNVSSTGSITNSELNLNSGTFNLVNGKMDTIGLTNFNANAAGTLHFDADLNAGTNDKITVSGIAAGELVSTINITQASNTPAALLTLVTGSNISGLTLKDTIVTYTNYGKYTFTGSTNGVYSVALEAAEGINEAVANNTLISRSFSATGDTTVTGNLGPMGMANSTLDIFGNGYNINGIGYSGVSVASGQTLNIIGVGSTASGKSWNGFTITGSGAAINNSGITSILNSVFTNNTATSNGGVIYNLATVNLGTSGYTDTTSFVNNKSTSGNGGAIWNNKTLNSNSGVTFAGNYTNISSSGGAIYNTSTTAVATIDGNTFKYNGYSDYNPTTDTASTVSTVKGGAIYNTASGKVAITNSTFNNNASTGNGGAILSDSAVANALVIGTSGSTDTTKFINNKTTTGLGGAIYNSGILNSYAGVTFAGNYTSNSGLGGAIYATSAAAVTTIDGNTFKWNGYNDYNPTTDTAVTTVTNRGGAIFNDTFAQLNITNSIFNNNASLNSGGAIANYSTINIGTSGSTDTTSFISNRSSSGGAIWNNSGVLNLYSGVTFSKNFADSGGAIWNNKTLNSNNGITYAGNYTNSSGSGGAIYNTSATAVTTIDGNTFKYNGYSNYNSGTGTATTVSTSRGGAFDNETSATANITNSTFNNNAAISYGGAIYNNSATLNLNSGVTFAGNFVNSSGRGGAIYNSGVGAVATIAGNTFKYNGYSDYNSGTDLASTILSTNGGAICNDSSAKLDITDSTFTNNGAITNGGAIWNNSNSSTIGITIGVVGSTDTTKFVNNSTGASGTGGAISNFGLLNSYTGVTFAGNYTGISGSGGAIYNSGASAITTVNGNIFKWNGYSNYNSGTDTATTVSTSKGGAIYNTSSGKIAITNSIFNNNASTGDGGTIWNAATVNIGTSGSTDTTSFTNNKSTTGHGGAIYNSSTLNSYSGVTFAGNYVNGTHYGSAIMNVGASAIATIVGNTFKYNGYSDYNSTTGTASTVSTFQGGAIHNDTSAQLNITSSKFNNNAATSGGGLYNIGTINIGTSGSTDTTSFINNQSTTANGGAIYNSGVLNSYAGVTFAGNYTGASGAGGAIYNIGASSSITIDGNTFKWNGYSNYSSETDTATTVATTYGGAIYNDSSAILKIANSSFTNNAVITSGGAIYNNNASNTYIQGDGAGNQTLFQGNLANGVSNAIYLAGTDATTNSSNLYLNAGNSGKIISYDGIAGSNKDYNFIYINSSDATAKTSFIDGTTVLTNGEVDLYGNISDVTINNSAGITNVGRASNPVIASTNSLWNISGGTVNVNNTAFSGTSSTAGGVISNTAGTLNIGTSGLTDASSFINCSSSSSNGGAIYNASALNIYKGVTFAGNYTDSANFGGAIFNTGGSAVASITGNTFKYNGYSDYNFTTDTATTVSTQKGGAIYNNGVLKTTNTSFTNNAATENGGAIYNNAGTTAYIQGDGAGKQTLFQGNKANGVSNAIYLAGTDATTNASKLYLNAGNSGEITSYDAISGSNTDYNNIYINSSDATASTSFIDGSTLLTNGTVNLYDDVTGVTVYDYAGTTNFGNSSSPKAGCYNGTIFNLSGGTQNFNNGITSATINASGGTQNLQSAIATSTINSTGGVQNLNNTMSDSSLTVNGGTLNVTSTGSIANSSLTLTSGTLNLANNKMDTIGLTNFNASSAGILNFDADLEAGTNDKITVSGIATGQLTSTVNITKDTPINGNSTLTLVTGSNISGLALQNIGPTYTTYGKYTFTGSTNGTYNVLSEWAGGLNTAVAIDEYALRTYSGTADTTVTGNLGPMGLANSTLSIYGNGYSINGAGASGVSVASGQTLNISGVGSFAGGKSWNGFTITGDGAAINNSGSTSILNSVFTNNTATNNGGIILNNDTLNIGASSSTDTSMFIKNSSTYNGGAIYNTKILNSYSGVTYAGNFTATNGLGGAIYNTGASAVTTIDGNIFKYNGYSDYNSGTDTATTVATSKGGAIYNNSSARANITNSTFSKNASTGNGGAILNEATVSIGTSGSTDTTSFVNNKSTTSHAGAIYNTGTLNSYAGVTFAGNYTNYGQNGGAIYNTGASAVATIDGATFKWNGYNNYNPVADTATNRQTSYGGAIYNNSSGTVNITNSIFSNNASTSGGGAICNSSTNLINAVTIGTSGSTDTTSFTNNYSGGGSGGAIFNTGLFKTYGGVTFIKNHSGNNGGAIYNSGTLNSYSNVIFAGNYTGATNNGGAIWNTGTSAIATIDGATFKWNGYNNYSSGTDTATIVATQNGGAIYNNSSAQANITNSTFSNNSSTVDGGAIWNNSSIAGGGINIGTSSTTDTTKFINNKSTTASGGAIYNTGILNSYAGVYFAGNYTTSNSGGASYNQGTMTLVENAFKWNGYSNYNSTNDDATNVSTNRGGAIYNEASAALKISNTSFTNNAATAFGGAIYNKFAAKTYLQGDGVGKETLFQGNKAAGVSNAIYLGGTDATTNASNLYLNAGNSGSITSYDAISGSNVAFNNIYINSSDATASTSFIDGSTLLTDGVVNLYDNITGATVYDYAGTTNFGNSSSPKAACYNGTVFNISGGIQNFNNGITSATINSTGGTQNLNNSLTDSSLTINGGTLNVASTGSIAGTELNLTSGNLNLVNGITDTVALTDFNANAAGTLSFDVDLDTGINDKITVSGVASGELVSSINITQGSIDPASPLTLITGSNISGLTLKDTIATYTTYNKYIFIGSNNGTYNVTMEWSGGLNSAVSVDTLPTRAFSATGDTTITDSLGPMGLANSTLNIYGNGHNINGIGYAGISTSAGQILNISGVGSTATNKSWNGFISTNGGAINNSGTTSITNSIFSSNSATANGGVAYNNLSGTLNIGTSSTTDTSLFANNSSTNDGGAIYNKGTLNSNKGVTYAGNYTENTNSGGAIYNADSTATATFNNNTFKYNGYSDYSSPAGIDTASTVSTLNGGAIYNTNSATVNVSNSTFTNNTSNLNGGAIYNIDSAKAYIAGSTFSNNTAGNNGGAIYNNSTAIIENSSFTNNTATTGKGGAIYNTGSATLNIIADNSAVSFTGNKANGVSNSIYLDATSKMNINAGNTGSITFNDKIISANLNEININKPAVLKADGVSPAPTNGTVNLNSNIENSTVNLYNGTLTLGSDNYLNNNNLNLNGGNLSLMNNAVGTMSLNALQINAPINLKIDADLAAGTADYLTAHSVSGTGSLNVSRINLLSDSKTPTNIPIADTLVRNYVQLDTATAESAIYKYNLSYNSSTGAMNFVNTQNFTPSIITPQVSAMVGSYLTQTNTYHEALGNLDSIMFMPKLDRLLYTSKNKTASTNGTFVFSPLMLHEDTKGLWCKQFSTFENVPLNNGPNVSNVGYGALIGGDTELTYLGKGFTGYLTPYAGYNGSHQNYENVGTYQNGGILGLTGTVYKNDFFLALTANMSANNGTASTTSGEDNFTTLVAGLAAKAGYNYEIMHGKVIIQPSLMMAYTFAKTFDYSTSSGANITSDPLNAIQISPGLKIIGNLRDNWQPYLGVNMVWNIMDTTKFYANDAQLPQMSVAPYLEYGIGLQRKWGERFSGFGQAMLRGGGRNGLALQFGFRYSLGK